MTKKYYLSYGSNLNKLQMKQRCPQATQIGSAMLDGWQLVFRKVATLEKHLGASVPVGIWQITDECEKSLDFFEGYPAWYRKEELAINMGDKTLTVMVYLINYGDIELPTDEYYQRIKKGYQDFGLDESFLVKAFDQASLRRTN